jgi:hypothetical protein
LSLFPPPFNLVCHGFLNLVYVSSCWFFVSHFGLYFIDSPLIFIISLLYFVLYKYCDSCLFSWAISLVNLLLAFHSKPIFISVNIVGLLWKTDCWIFHFNPVCQTVSFDGGVESISIQC